MVCIHAHGSTQRPTGNAYTPISGNNGKRDFAHNDEEKSAQILIDRQALFYSTITQMFMLKCLTTYMYTQMFDYSDRQIQIYFFPKYSINMTKSACRKILQHINCRSPPRIVSHLVRLFGLPLPLSFHFLNHCCSVWSLTSSDTLPIENLGPESFCSIGSYQIFITDVIWMSAAWRQIRFMQ